MQVNETSRNNWKEIQLCGPAVRYSSSCLFSIQWNANYASKLYKAFMFYPENLCAFCKRMVAQNAAVSLACCLSALIRPQITIIYVCPCDCAWSHVDHAFSPAIWFQFSSNVLRKTFPQHEFEIVAQYIKKVLLTQVWMESNFFARGSVPERTYALCMSASEEKVVCVLSHRGALCSFPCLKYNSTITLRARSAFLIYCSGSSASPSSTPACHKAAIIGRYSWPS